MNQRKSKISSKHARILSHSRPTPAAVALLSILAGTITAAPDALGASRPTPEVLSVASMLEGTLESTEQAIEQRGEFIPVRLTQCRVRVDGAPARAAAGAVFLYTEQAVTTGLAAPYRQRFTRLSPLATGSASNPTVVSSVFEPAGDTKAFVGLCSRPEAQRVVDFADIGSSDCSVHLTRKGDTWAGKTPGEGCPSVYRGAVRVTSEAVITEEGMSSWDRGYGEDGAQVWGAESGPYEFLRVDPARVDTQADQMAWRLSGRFSNAAQVAADPSFAPVDYVMCPVTLTGGDFAPGTRANAVRQAITLPGNRIIVRKRVYLVRAGEGATRAMEFLDFAPSALDKEPCSIPRAKRVLDVADLVDSRCAMDFSFDPAQRAYVGRTREGGCASEYQGSSSLVIEGTLRPSSLEIQERWLDAEGRQVAGSTKGPYVYVLEGSE